MVQLAVWIVATVIVGIAVVYGLFLMVGIVSPISMSMYLGPSESRTRRVSCRIGCPAPFTVQVEASYQGRPRHVGREGARTTAS